MRFFIQIQILLMFGLFGCNAENINCADIELEIESLCDKNDETKEVYIKDFTDFEWEKLYVIYGPTSDNEVSDITGVPSSDVIQEGEHQFFYIKNGEIVEKINSCCNTVVFITDVGKAYLSYDRLDQLLVIRNDDEEGIRIKVLKK